MAPPSGLHWRLVCQPGQHKKGGFRFDEKGSSKLTDFDVKIAGFPLYQDSASPGTPDASQGNAFLACGCGKTRETVKSRTMR